MGRFEKHIYSEGSWSDEAVGLTWLSIDIHDSDFATVEFAPFDDFPGLFYLGFQPRDYFEDPSASEDVDSVAQANALARWAEAAVSSSLDPKRIIPLMADDGVDEPLDDFVEETVTRLLELLGLPTPAGISQ